MTLEQAHEISAALARQAIGHIVHVGYHPGKVNLPLGTTEHSEISASISVPWPRYHHPRPGEAAVVGRSRSELSLAQQVQLIEGVAHQHGCALECSILGDSLQLVHVPGMPGG